MKKLIITETQAKLLGLIKTPKNTLKITQEQYDRIFGSKIVTEGFDVKGGGTRVDKAFKVEALKELEEPIKTTEFNLSKLKTSGGLPNKPSFGKVMEEVEGQEDLSTEFIKFLYGKGELSELWSEDKIREAIAKLSSKNLIIPTEDGNFKVSTSLGDPKTAMDAIRQELEAIKPQAEEMGQELISMDSEQGLEEYGGPDEEPNPIKQTIKTNYKVVGMNEEISILVKGGKLFAFHFWDDTEKIKMVNANLEGHDNLDNIIIGGEAIENYVNDAAEGISNILNIGKGLEYYKSTEYAPIEGEVNIVVIDEDLKNYLLELFNNNPNIVSVLTNELDEEIDRKDLKGKLVAQLKQKDDRPKFSPEEIAANLAAKRQASKEQEKSEADKAEIEKAKYLDKEIDEMTGASSSGAFTGPLFGKMTDEEIIRRELNEMTSGSESTGEYTMPAFKMKKNHTDFADVTTKAEKTPQWAGGSFVEFNDCTKLNNKPAGSGCSAGAVDGVVKLKKAKGSVNAPSLAENKIYETIAAKTGKSIDEVKRIIKSKNGKA